MERSSPHASPPGSLQGYRRTGLARRLARGRRIGGEILRGEGLGRVFARAGVVFGAIVYRHVVVVALDLSQPLREVDTDVSVEVRLLHPEDLQAYARFRGTSVADSPLLARVERGDLCSSVWLEGEIVAAAWVAFDRVWVDEIGRELRLAADEACAYDSYTAERLRGRNVAAVRARWLAEYLRAAGYKRLVGWISPQNRPAFAPARKIGYRTAGTAGFVRLGPWRREFLHPIGGRRSWSRRDQPIEIEREFGAVLASQDAGPPERRRDA